MKLSDYYEEVYLEPGESLGVSAYSLDGGNETGERGGANDMAHAVGLACHCCDYFIFEKGVISLIEIKQLAEYKKNMELKLLAKYSRKEFFEERFNEQLTDKCMLKMYGSMLVLFIFSADYKAMPKDWERGPYNFFLVDYDAREEDVRATDHITLTLRDKLESNLKSAGSSKFIKTVSILNTAALAQRIKSKAVLPS